MSLSPPPRPSERDGAPGCPSRAADCQPAVRVSGFSYHTSELSNTRKPSNTRELPNTHEPLRKRKFPARFAGAMLVAPGGGVSRTGGADLPVMLQSDLLHLGFVLSTRC